MLEPVWARYFMRGHYEQMRDPYDKAGGGFAGVAAAYRTVVKTMVPVGVNSLITAPGVLAFYVLFLAVLAAAMSSTFEMEAYTSCSNDPCRNLTAAFIDKTVTFAPTSTSFIERLADDAMAASLQKPGAIASLAQSILLLRATLPPGDPMSKKLEEITQLPADATATQLMQAATILREQILEQLRVANEHYLPVGVGPPTGAPGIADMLRVLREYAPLNSQGMWLPGGATYATLVTVLLGFFLAVEAFFAIRACATALKPPPLMAQH